MTELGHTGSVGWLARRLEGETNATAPIRARCGRVACCGRGLQAARLQLSEGAGHRRVRKFGAVRLGLGTMVVPGKAREPR